MKPAILVRIKEKCRKEDGFTLLEMVIAAALVSIFFTMAAFVVPVWYRAYDRAVNQNYARQIANSVIGAVEQQIRFADQVEIIEAKDGVQRITGKYQLVRFHIPMEGSHNMIDGLVYDEDFFIQNDISLAFELSPDKSSCTIAIKVRRDGEMILEKTRAVMLVGENGGSE